MPSADVKGIARFKVGHVWVRSHFMRNTDLRLTVVGQRRRMEMLEEVFLIFKTTNADENIFYYKRLIQILKNNDLVFCRRRSPRIC